MPNTKTMLGLMTVAAVGAIVAVLATRLDKTNQAPAKKTRGEGHWKEGTRASFTGWLEKLKVSIDNEVRNTV